MKRGRSYDWIPLWIDKWLMGSTRFELDPGERSVFLDLLVVGAKDDGFIRANAEMGYPHEYLSRTLNVSLELLESALSKCIKYSKIQALENGIYYIINWKPYSLSQRHKKRVMSQKGDKGSQKSDPLYVSVSVSVLSKEIIEYLNKKTGKKLNPKSSDTIKHITARVNEGRTIDDFKRVIDVKVAKWKGKTWKDSRPGREGQIVNGDDFLCPSTLFCAKNFENYLNESGPAKAETPEQYLARHNAETKKLQEKG